MKNFDNCKNVIFRVTAKADFGADIKDAIKECIEFAKATKCEVTLNFNGIDLYIRDYHTVDAIRKCYDKEIEEIERIANA
mgnify:CR=1 FL=1